MFPEKRLWDFWEFELSLFSGVSETPEGMYDSTFRSHHEIRLSRGATENEFEDNKKYIDPRHLCDLEFDIDKLEYRELKMKE